MLWLHKIMSSICLAVVAQKRAIQLLRAKKSSSTKNKNAKIQWHINDTYVSQVVVLHLYRFYGNICQHEGDWGAIFQYLPAVLFSVPAILFSVPAFLFSVTGFSFFQYRLKLNYKFEKNDAGCINHKESF